MLDTGPPLPHLDRRARPSSAYGLLARNQVRTQIRALKAQHYRYLWLVFGFLGLYVTFTLVTLGLFFDRFSHLYFSDLPPVVAVNRYVLPTFASLFVVRFLFQKTPKLHLRPYLHLPVSRRRLVRFFQLTSLLSLHNLFPLLFFVPFTLRFVVPFYGEAGAAAWLGCIVLLLIGSTYGNNLARSTLNDRASLFFAVATILGLLTIIDHQFDTLIVPTVSGFVFLEVGRLSPAALGLFAAVTMLLYAGSGALLWRSLRATRRAAPKERSRLQVLDRLQRFGPVGALLMVDLRLIWRNKRPRHYFLISILFSTGYLLFLLANPGAYGGVLFGAIIGLFASGGFAMNYGQLMFSWESSYFDGMLARSTELTDVIRAKVWLLQGSCFILFVLSLPLFLWLRPDLIGLHVAFMLYNAGVTSLLVLYLALHNQRPVDIGRNGGFFNYEGFSAIHWLWIFPVTLPPTILLVLVHDLPAEGLPVIAGLGLMSLLATPLWTRHFATTLTTRRHRMAEGFRSYDA